MSGQSRLCVSGIVIHWVEGRPRPVSTATATVSSLWLGRQVGIENDLDHRRSLAELLRIDGEHDEDEDDHHARVRDRSQAEEPPDPVQ